MSYIERVTKLITDGKLDPKRNDLGINLGPDDCTMGFCGNKKGQGSDHCAECRVKFSQAVNNMVEEERGELWKY